MISHVFPGEQKMRGSAHGGVDKAAPPCYNEKRRPSAFLMRCSPKEVAKMGCKKRLNKQKTGNKIYQAIDRSGKSYDKVAEELGLLSSRVIYEWVNGNKLPSLTRIAILADFLGVHIEDLLELE